MADDQTFYDAIEGYCGSLSCAPGAAVPLHVSTRAEWFDVRVERWGAERELVWSADRVAGTYVEPPVGADSDGCAWPVSLTIPVGQWRSGFYLVTLTASDAPAGRDVAHACFVVRAAEQRKRMLLALCTNTWNAYNTWGGMSLYTGGKEVSFQRPFARGMLCRPHEDRDDRKARPRRWGEEPDPDGLIFQEYRTERGYPSAIGSTGWFTHERRFVEWAEACGYELDFCVSADLERPGVVSGYDLVLGVGHDEYWSGPARDVIEAFVADDGNYASLSGNTMFWQVRLEAPAGSAPNDRHQMVCHKYSAHRSDPLAADDPAQMTGLWCDPLVGRPEWNFLGAGSAWGLYHRFGQATPRATGGFTVYRDDHWLVGGSGLRYGDLLGGDSGAVGYETVGCRLTFDELQQPVAVPEWMAIDGSSVAWSAEAVDIVAFAPASNLGVGQYPKSIAALSDQGDTEFLAERLYGRVDAETRVRVEHGNAVMLVCRPFGVAGGEVVTIGSTDWVFGLAEDSAVQQVTKNVLDRALT